MVRVLFVCLGNICRSPMAEAVFLQLVREAGLQDRIHTDSAGTGDWHVGQRPHAGTLKILARHNIPEGSRARVIEPADLDRFDYVVVMDNSNRKNVLSLAPGNKSSRVSRLLDWAPGRTEKEVPDPYFTGGFDEVYQMVREGCTGLLDHIRREQAWE